MAFRLHFVAALALLSCSGLAGQTKLTLQEAGQKKPPEYAPAYDGKDVVVEGVASVKAILFPSYAHLPIQDSAGYGLTIEAELEQLEEIEPGDLISVRGLIANRHGLPVIRPAQITKLGSDLAPARLRTRLQDLVSDRPLSTLVEVEAHVVSSGENSGGETLILGDPKGSGVRVFLPNDLRRTEKAFTRFQPGDRVRVSGLHSQYCPRPPFTRGYELVVTDPDSVHMVSRSWFIQPETLAMLTMLGCLAAFLWWLRERQNSRQRRIVRGLMTLAEEVSSAATPAEIVRKLIPVLPKLLRASDASLFLFSPSTNSLDRVPTEHHPEPESVRIDSPIGQLSSAVALCFRNRALLAIPNTRRSPILTPGAAADMPRSALFVPMFAQHELLGVLAVHYAAKARCDSDEQTTIQHLANQIAASLKLQDRQSIREQLLRSEKMAAAGQLISAVVNELRAPLHAITDLARRVLAKPDGPLLETDLRAIGFEAGRGVQVIERLLSFGKPDQTETKPIDLNALVTGLMEFREREWHAKGIQARKVLPSVPLVVLGSQTQFEQAILNLLVHAEHCLAHSQEKTLTVTARSSGGRILLAIEYSDELRTTEPFDPFEDQGSVEALGLHVCQAIVQSQGGEIRMVHTRTGESRFEISLPSHVMDHTRLADAPEAPVRPAAVLTVLLVEPETQSQRQFLSLLSARGHRVVPVPNAEQALDMIHRLRFEAVFCSVRLPGLNWVEFHEKIRRQVGAFVLLTEGVDLELSRAFKGGEGYVLTKPADEADLNRVLMHIESRQVLAARS